MNTKVSDLTVEELRKLISEVVQEKIEDAFEESAMLLDKDYIQSVKEARKDYKEGRVKDIDDVNV